MIVSIGYRLVAIGDGVLAEGVPRVILVFVGCRLVSHCSRRPRLGRKMQDGLTGHHGVSSSIHTVKDDNACCAVSLASMLLIS